MGNLPQPHAQRRATRVRLPGTPPAVIRLADGQSTFVKLTGPFADRMATPLQVASAYTAFANGGMLAESHPIKRVTNTDGVGVTEIKSQTQQALRPEISWLMTNIMQDVINRGTASRARAMGLTEKAVAGKTGTSRDGWFAGYTPNVVCVVWVGFDDNSELGLEGAKSALPIWTSFMKAALALRPELGGESFPAPPDGIVSAEIDPTSGILDTGQCPTRSTEYFIQGTHPLKPCEGHTCEHPELAPVPGFQWPEDQMDIENKAKKLLRDAEKVIDETGRELNKQIKKAAGKP